jgi:hypothetical protein
MKRWAWLVFVLVGMATTFAVRECWDRGQRAYIRAIIRGNCPYTWSPEKMAAHRARTEAEVRRDLLASRLWTGAGWLVIGLDGLLLTAFVRSYRKGSAWMSGGSFVTGTAGG